MIANATPKDKLLMIEQLCNQFIEASEGRVVGGDATLLVETLYDVLHQPALSGDFVSKFIGKVKAHA